MNDESVHEFVFDNPKRIIVLVEGQDGKRVYAEFKNLIAPAILTQTYQNYFSWQNPGAPVVQYQEEPIMFSIPNFGGWTFYETDADFTPEREPIEAPKELEP